MPVVVDFVSIGLTAIAAILFVKFLVLATPLNRIPGLPQVIASV